MAKAIPVSEKQWKAAINIKDNQSLFNFLTKNYMIKQPVPAIKVPPVEFFFKKKS